MKLAYVTPYDSRSLGGSNTWSGTGYFIGRSLEKQLLELDYIGPLKSSLLCQLNRKYKQQYYKLFGKKYLKNSSPCILKDYARQIESSLSKNRTDVVFSASANPVAYLECSQPVVFWADASFASIVDFYPEYSDLCQETIDDWHHLERLSHQKCTLAIYSSDWAAKAAADYYNADESKVRVVPFGANIVNESNFREVKEAIKLRPNNLCKLLFLGVDWHRKGGDTALKVVKGLVDAGLNAELKIVGCQPISSEPLPDFVKPLGFISKSTEKGKATISRLVAESHFLILPSLADCTPIVLCEANSLGTPCLTTNVGGIPTIVKDGLNGKTFEVSDSHLKYCHYILNLFEDYSNYIELALESYNQYKLRLNWEAAGQTVKSLLLEM